MSRSLVARQAAARVYRVIERLRRLLGGYLCGSESEFHVWWRFDPIDNVRGRLREHGNDRNDLSMINVFELLGMFVAAWMLAKQSDVLHAWLTRCSR